MRRLMILSKAEEAFFHQFVVLPFQDSTVMALVEMMDGKPKTFPLHDVQFISPPESGDPFADKLIGQVIQRELANNADESIKGGPPRFKYMTRGKLQHNTRLGNAISDWLLHLGLPYTMAAAFDVMIEVERLSEGSEAEALDILRLNLERKNKKLYWDHEFRSNVPDLFMFDWSEAANKLAAEMMPTAEPFPESHELPVISAEDRMKNVVNELKNYQAPTKNVPVQTLSKEQTQVQTEPVVINESPDYIGVSKCQDDHDRLPGISFGGYTLIKPLQKAIRRWITYLKQQSRYNGKFSASAEHELYRELHRISEGYQSRAVDIINYSLETDAGVLIKKP